MRRFYVEVACEMKKEWRRSNLPVTSFCEFPTARNWQAGVRLEISGGRGGWMGGRGIGRGGAWRKTPERIKAQARYSEQKIMGRERVKSDEGGRGR